MIIDQRTKEFLDPAEGELFGRYSAIIRRLRAPDGCPWDRKQTLKSLRRFLLEESMEAIAAIDEYVDSGQVDAPETLLEPIADELGDVTLVVMLLSSALRDAGGSSFSDILTMNGEKLIRRHPHVFGDLVVNDSETVVRNWNEIKRDQEGRTESPAAVPRGLQKLCVFLTQRCRPGLDVFRSLIRGPLELGDSRDVEFRRAVVDDSQFVLGPTATRTYPSHGFVCCGSPERIDDNTALFK